MLGKRARCFVALPGIQIAAGNPVVPEPGSVALLCGLFIVGGLALRRREHSLAIAIERNARMKTSTLLRALCAATLAVITTTPIPAQVLLASDNAADPAYNNGWTNGANGGVGFQPWI